MAGPIERSPKTHR